MHQGNILGIDHLHDPNGRSVHYQGIRSINPTLHCLAVIDVLSLRLASA